MPTTFLFDVLLLSVEHSTYAKRSTDKFMEKIIKLVTRVKNEDNYNVNITRNLVK